MKSREMPASVTEPAVARGAGNSAPPPPRLGALTGIRGIAAWLVVFYHIRLSMVDLVPPDVIGILAKGYLAVDLFFVLSGFVLWYNYAPRLRADAGGQRAVFLWRRIARIWPLHAFILAGFGAFAAVLALTGRDVSGYPLAELPLHILLMQNWGFTTDLTWNHPAWSISTEFAAYLLFPFIVAAARWERMPAPVLLALAFGLAAAVAALFFWAGAENLGDRIAQLGLWRCLAAFCLGNIVCLLWLRWKDHGAAAALAALACVCSVGAGLVFDLPEAVFVPGAFFSGILALALDQGRVSAVLCARPLIYLGEISYSTYLAHFFLFILFKIAFVDESLQLGWADFAGFCLLLLAVSAALFHLVEKPAQRWLGGLRPGRRAAGAIAAAE